MKHAIVLAGAVTALGLGARLARADHPAWCTGAPTDAPDLSKLKSDDPKEVMAEFVIAACSDDPDVVHHRAELEGNRVAWAKRLGMDESDWADEVAYMKTDLSRDAGKHGALSTKDFAKYTPYDQYLAIIDGFSVDDARSPMAYKDPAYYADVFGDQLGMLGRYAYLTKCMAARTHRGEPPVAEWAMCQADVDAWSFDTFAKELHADPHPGEFKQQLRFDAFDIKARLDKHAADVAAAKQRDPVYPQMFDAAAKARTEWSGIASRSGALLDLVQSMDNAKVASSRSRFAGCGATTAAALAKAVGGLPASKFKGLHDVRFDPSAGFAEGAGPILAADPEVSLAAMAYIQCQPTTGTADFLAAFMMRTPGFRGPRTTALSRILDTKLQLDDTRAKLELPDYYRLWERTGGAISSVGGQVASTKADGDVVVVTLAKLMVKSERCAKSHATNHISEILVNGEVRYEQICDKSETVEENEQWDPMKVSKDFAGVLKAGVKFSAVNANGDRDRGMDVIAVWSSATAQEPSWLLGAKLK